MQADMKLHLREKYGQTALVAGASEGIGAAFAEKLASEGINLVLLARRGGLLKEFAATLRKYNVEVSTIAVDLSQENAIDEITKQINGMEVDILVYNAALSHIGPFSNELEEKHLRMASVNMLSPLKLIHKLVDGMLERGRGAIILMSSLAGFQGSPYISMYAATKAFNRVFGESLWYEWKDKGVDVIACNAGSTATPGFKNSNPEKSGLLVPRVQEPAEVVEECLKALGRKPSIITGRGNRIASFFMQKLFSRKMAVNTMGDNTRKMYRI